MLADRRTLPPNFTRDVIMKAPSRDMMNSITRSILQLYSYDEKADDTSIPNVLRQCLNLIAQFPMLMVYGYHAYNYKRGEDLYIYAPDPNLSTAENILMMLREDRQYTELEAKILDMALVLHMDHGGGNNSTFTTHVVTSSGTDTYSTIAAAMASLKGPKHGGANIKVTRMFEDMKAHLTDWTDDDQIRAYLEALLEKRAFDNKGLIYGMGHAVYSISDPRADIFKKFVKQLAHEKGHDAEYALYEKVEHMAPEIISEKRQHVQGRKCKRRLLQRTGLQHAGPAGVALYADLRGGAYRRLERAPAGRAPERGQDHPSRLQAAGAVPRLRKYRRQVVSNHER